MNPEAPSFRVLLLATDPFGTGGIQRATRALTCALVERFHCENVGVLAVWAGDRIPPGARVLDPGIAPGPGGSSRVPLHRKAAYTARSLVIARGWRSRLVVVAAHPHLAPVAWLCRVVSGAPYAVWCYGRETWGQLPRPVRWAIRRADVVVAISQFTAERVVVAAGIERHRVTVVPLPCGESGEQVPAPALRSNSLVVLTVARLTATEHYKGIDTLLAAWPLISAEVPTASLVVVGDGDDRPRLERLAECLGLQGSIRFAGRISDEALAEAYASAAVFALPARLRLGRRPQGEGFGLVYVEAAAHGLPTVAGRGGGVDEAVIDGETGLLVDPEEPLAVADAIVRLLTDATLARRLGNAGRERVANEFGFGRFADEWTGILHGLVDDQLAEERRACAASLAS